MTANKDNGKPRKAGKTMYDKVFFFALYAALFFLGGIIGALLQITGILPTR